MGQPSGGGSALGELCGGAGGQKQFMAGREQSGEQRQEHTEWRRVVVWGRQADTCAEYLSKGRRVYVEGRLQTRSWEDEKGNKRFMTEVVAGQVLFLDSASDRQHASGGAGRKSASSAASEQQPGAYQKEPSFGGEAESQAGSSAGADSSIPF